MEGTNSFDKGLHLTNSPQMQPEGTYVDAFNWIRNDSGRLLNEELEVVIKSLPNYEILGHTSINNEFILFFKVGSNSEIGTFSKENGYTKIFNDGPLSYKLNFTNPIDSTGRIVGSVSDPAKATTSIGDRVVYFVEKGQKARRFNLDQYLYDNTKYNDVVDWNLQLNINIPYAIPTIVNTGGNLPSGAYSFIFRYRTDENNKSVFGIPSRMIYINDDIVTSDDGDGCPPQTQTSKYINLNITQTDLNYPYIEPIVITYLGLTNVLSIKSLGIYPNKTSQVIRFTDESQYKDSVSLEEINENPIFYDSAECIEQKDNTLILSNLTTKKYDRNFQDVANAIDVCWYYGGDILPTTHSIVNEELDPDDDVEYGGSDYWRWNTDKEPNYLTDGQSAPAGQTYKRGDELKGFQRGEIYSFSITPIYKDGSIGYSYHIPAKPTSVVGGMQTTDVYTSELEYPDYIKNDYPSLGNFIKHHRMPDYTNEDTPMKCLSIEKGILKVKFKNIKFSPSQKEAIQGYILGYQQRNSDANTRIIDTGWGRPYMRNGNYFAQSILNGSCVYIYPNNSSMTFAASTDVGIMYHSPDTLLGKELQTGYQLQIYGCAENINRNAYYSDDTKNPSEPFLGTVTYDWADIGFFFNQKTTVINCSNKVYINALEKVLSIGEDQEYTIRGKYKLTGCTPYVHMETNSNIWTSSAWGTYYNPPSFVRNKNGDRWMGWKKTTHYIPLMRVLNETGSQYGNLDSATYVPAAVIFNTSDAAGASVEVEGDVFATKFWHFNTDSVRNHFTGSGYNDAETSQDKFHFLAGIQYESKNNYHMRHYDIGEVPYYPKSRVLTSTNASTLGVVNFPYYNRSVGYNKQYSAVNNNKLQVARPLFFQDNTNYFNRTIYSSQSFEGELVDQYRNFPALQYHDIPKERGFITDTFVFDNNLYIHTQYALWQAYFNPNTIQSTTQGNVVLGNSGIFKIPSKLILDIKGGYMGTLDKSGINTPFGRVFVDHSQGKVFFLTSEAPVEISDLGLFPFFRDFITKDNAEKISLGYDWKNKRVLLSNRDYFVGQNNPVIDVTNTRLVPFLNAYEIGTLDTSVKFKNTNTGTTGINPRAFIKFTISSTSDVVMVFNGSGIDNTVYIYKKNGPIYNEEIYSDSTSSVRKTLRRKFTFLPGDYYVDITPQGFASYDFSLNLISDTSSISFYPKTQTWTSFHSFVPDTYMSLNREFFAFSNQAIWNMENVDNIRKEAKITFINNELPDSFKRYDRLEINTSSGGIGGIKNPGGVSNKGHVNNFDNSFTTINVWNDYQNSSELPFMYSHDYDILSGYDNSLVSVKFYRNSYHCEIPLDSIKNPYNEIFAPDNIDLNKEFKSPMKGKFLYTKLSDKNTLDSNGNTVFANKPLVLNYVKTFFKPTVA